MGRKLQNFNSDINTIGGIPNFEVLYFALKNAADEDTKELKNVFVINNEYNVRTEEARKRIIRGIKANLLQFRNEEHRDLVISICSQEGMQQQKQFILFWQMALNNDLFFATTLNVFIKLYFSGRTTIPKDEVESYIIHLKEDNPDLKKWSEKTISTLSTKYLTFFRKIGFLQGSKKREFNYIIPENDTFILFVYLMKSVFPDTPNIYDTGLFDFLFMSKEAFIDRAKRAENLYYYDYSYNGVELKLEPKFSTKEIINVLSERTKTKV